MQHYKGFAVVYDELMADAPYERWGKYITEILQKQKSKLVLDLACGTGNMTLLLAKKGFDMIGVDLSEDMLATAQQKMYEENQRILFLAQDMRELDLYGTVDAVICVCDGLNYILDPSDLTKVFARVKLFLNPGGIFIFDINTEYKFKEVMANRIFEGESAKGAAYEWENNFNEETRINEYRVTFFNHQNPNEEPFTEIHKQRAYTQAEIIRTLKETGFCNILVCDDYTGEPSKPNSTRLAFTANGSMPGSENLCQKEQR